MNNIPTIAQLYTDIIAALEAEFSTTIPFFGKNYLRVQAIVQAGKLKLYYLLLGKLQKNIWVDTADPESKGGTLERFGRTKINRNPFAAQAAQYEIEIIGTIGATVPAQSTFKSNDDSLNPGRLYILDSAYILVATTDYITVRALDAGLDASLNNGDQLTATAPIANVDSLANVSSEVIEPLAAETIEAYRNVVLNTYRLESQGGAVTDYRLWSQDVQGVAAVYPYNKGGATSAEINLYIEATTADSTDGKGTPSAGIISDVEDVVDTNPDTTLDVNERGRRPMQVIVHYLPVTIKEVEIDIADFVGITAAKEALILAAMTTAINSVRPFISGADVLEDKNDILDINKIISTVLSAQPGSIFGTVTLLIDGVPLSTFTFEDGDIPFLNPVTYS